MAIQLATFTEIHLILLLIIIFLLFGGKKLPELARGLGEAMREFKKASRDLHDEPQQTVDKSAQLPSAQPTASASQHPSEPKQG
jgi:sec-independent protein translocase protein TatA